MKMKIKEILDLGFRISDFEKGKNRSAPGIRPVLTLRHGGRVKLKLKFTKGVESGSDPD